jgi:TrpR family trp operon transcriptional repressor
MQDLVTYLRDADSDDEMQNKLTGLLTPSEVLEMSKRLQIFSMLKDGVAQREIAKQLGVGIATVTRGSRALKELDDASSQKGGQ